MIIKVSSTCHKNCVLPLKILVHMHKLVFKENMGSNGSNSNGLQSCKEHLASIGKVSDKLYDILDRIQT